MAAGCALWVCGLAATLAGCGDELPSSAIACSPEADAGGSILAIDGGHLHPPDPVPVQYQVLVSPYPYDDPALALDGVGSYTAYCVRCHGFDGHGGPDAELYCPRPADLNAANRLHQDAYLFWRIHDGGTASDFRTAMPAYHGTLDDDQIWRVITTIRWRFIDF